MAERPLAASIIVIGDEILGGFVQDTNSGWLASRLQAHGIPLTRVVTVPDDAAEIDDALQTELARTRPRLVVTTGGIGSTLDDLTYEAIAASLGRPLVVATEIAARIEGAVEWTRQLGLEVDEDFVDHMMRMARIPAGSQLLRRSSGWAPGVRLDFDGGMDDIGGATVLILPGVPSELRAIVTRVVEPDILTGRGQPQTVSELVHDFPESVLNSCFARLAARYPSLKIGSYPGMPMRVRLRGRSEQVVSAFAELESYVRALEADPGGARLREAWAQRRDAGRRPAGGSGDVGDAGRRPAGGSGDVGDAGRRPAGGSGDVGDAVRRPAGGSSDVGDAGRNRQGNKPGRAVEIDREGPQALDDLEGEAEKEGV
ncbi:MAG: competence/damage-inducible protein A [Nitriliruptorales bacterium]